MPKPQPKPTAPLSKIETRFAQYAAGHQSHLNQVLGNVFIFPLMFGLMGLIWAIPFPQLSFLKAYNGYFNWASFFIAVLIFCYYKLSPMLSYIVLLILFGFSYGIIELRQLHAAGGPPMWLWCGIICLVSLIMLWVGHSQEPKKSSFCGNIYTGPLWVLHLLFKKLKLRY